MSTDYYEWRSKAEESGLLHRMAVSYYLEDSKQLYGALLNGEAITAPIFTYRDWVEVTDIEYPIRSFDEDKVSDFDREPLEEVARVMGHRDGNDDAEIEDYMWNGPVYGVESCEREGIHFDLVAADYYTVRERAARLEEEMYRGLYDAGFDPDASYQELYEQGNEVDTPYRDKVVPDFEEAVEFHDAPRLAGGNAVTIFNTGDGYKIPMIKRSGTVSESSGWWSPLPCGVFQPYHEDEGAYPKLRNHLYKEFAEYMFGLSPSDPLPDDFEPIEELDDILTDDSSDSALVHTATGIDCKNTNVQFYGALIIDDPEYYDQYINGLSDSWEFEEYRLVDVTDGEMLQKILNINVTNPYNVLGLCEALMLLEEEYNADLGVDLKAV